MGQVLGSMGWKPQELKAEPFCALLQLHERDLPPLKTILLLLDPADLKAVRLCCKSLNALCGYHLVKMEIGDSSQISTTAPIFSQFNYFR